MQNHKQLGHPPPSKLGIQDLKLVLLISTSSYPDYIDDLGGFWNMYTISSGKLCF